MKENKITAISRVELSHKSSKIARRPKAQILFWALGGLWLVVFIAALGLGSVPIPYFETFSILLKQVGLTGIEEINSTHEKIVISLRLPRILAATLVGWILAISGTTMQGVFRNPLASPYLLGIASGASVGAALVIVAGWRESLGGFGLAAGAFCGGGLAVALIYIFALRPGGRTSANSLILAGIALGALFSAITSFLIFISGDQMKEILFWIMGSLTRSNWNYLIWLAPIALVGALVLSLFGRELNALSLGEEGAYHLGIRPEFFKKILLLIVTLMTGAAVAVAGTIGFVGLITPHALRLIVGPDHRILLLASAIAGAIFLMLADLAARILIDPLEIPVGILTALIGAPFFLYLLLTRRGGEMR